MSEKEATPPFCMKIVYIGDFTGDKIKMGNQKFTCSDAALVTFPTPEDAQAAAKFLLQPTKFSAAPQYEKLLAEAKLYAPILEAAEQNPILWNALTAGTGIATTNGLRAAIAAIEEERDAVHD